MTKEEEFSEVLRTYGDTAYRMAFQLTGGREDEARDLVQDVFLQIWRRWDTHRPDSFKGWIYRLLHNLYIDHWRRAKRHPTLSLDAPAPGSETVWEQSLPEKAMLPAEQLEQKEAHARLAEAMKRMDTDFRVAVTLCDMEGMAYDEIAQIVGCPVGTVRSRIHRGRLQLRSLLGGRTEPEVSL